jgi:hypothetical protein
VIPNRLTARAIEPTLVCVEELSHDPSGFRYKAHFEYTNENYTSVYILAGSDNRLTSTGSFSGQVPQLFPKGTNQFEVLFDGSPLTWTVKSYYFTQLRTNSATASSDSPRCQNNSSARTFPSISSSEPRIYNLADELGEQVVAYPNPTVDYVNISISGITELPTAANISIVDQVGRNYTVKSNWQADNSILQLDLTNLDKGLYLIRINHNKGIQTLKIFKE